MMDKLPIILSIEVSQPPEIDMVAFSFHKQFADMVETGIKRQTIRENPRGATSGKKLQLYYGQRTKQCRKLLDAICKRTVAINLYADRVSPHVFRHSAAVWLAEAGNSMDVIAQVLGHSDSRITTAVYARFSPTYLRKAINALA